MDNQESVRVEVIEGDPSLPINHEDNVILKDWVVALLEPRPMAEAGFEITYEYDVDGILHVQVRDQKTGTIMMDDELAFGAAEDRSQLPKMKRRVDDLSAGSARTAASARPAHLPGSPGLSPESTSLLLKARNKILPFVIDQDRDLLERAMKALEASNSGTEPDCQVALAQEVRKHSYLL